MNGLMIVFVDGSVTKVSYSDNGVTGFTVSNGGLVLQNKDGGWLRWIRLDNIDEFRQY